MATARTTITRSRRLASGSISGNEWTWDPDLRQYYLKPIKQQFLSKDMLNSRKEVYSVSTKPWTAQGPIANTNHTNWYQSCTQDSCTFERHLPPYARQKPLGLYRRYHGSLSALLGLNDFQGLEQFPELPPASATYNKLLGKLKSDFNAAVALGEVHRSVGLIAQTAKRIASAVDFLVQGKRRAAMAVFNLHRLKRLNHHTRDAIRRKHRNKREREIASGWLELQYGWMPLLSDVYSAVEHAKDAPKNLVVRAGTQVQNRSKKDQASVFDFAGMTIDKTTILTTVTSHRMVLEYRVDKPYLERLSSVSLTNPLTLAWELLPFSFVIDWFLPIGNWLNGLDATLGLVFVKSVETVEYRTDQMEIYSPSKRSLNSSGQGIRHMTVRRKVRTPGSRFPSPQYPALKNPLSVQHASNALALMTGAFRTKS